MSVVEQGLRRVIGHAGEPDRRVAGLDDAALLALHRSLVLLQATGDVPAGEFSGPEVNVVLADNIQRSQHP
jgi:hypothetical protein